MNTRKPKIKADLYIYLIKQFPWAKPFVTEGNTYSYNTVLEAIQHLQDTDEELGHIFKYRYLTVRRPKLIALAEGITLKRYMDKQKEASKIVCDYIQQHG